MDKLTKYRQLIRKILDKYVAIQLANSPEIEIIIDEKSDHYQLIRLGFENNRRVYYCVFHFDIKNDKIWIQQDTTDIPVAQLLLDDGISNDDIVLAFHAPYRRELSGFAVA
jgi:XisI protein